ncbi:hypothetical protein EAF04_007685 [Stromatinia cepivora]|nr:hypothetical protein EAF04_007685 [Stromatinia cepivora]
MVDIELKNIESRDEVENGSGSGEGRSDMVEASEKPSTKTERKIVESEAAESDISVRDHIATRSNYLNTDESKKQQQIQDEALVTGPTAELQPLVTYFTRLLEESRDREKMSDEQILEHDALQLMEENSVTETSDFIIERKSKSDSATHDVRQTREETEHIFRSKNHMNLELEKIKLRIHNNPWTIKTFERDTGDDINVELLDGLTKAETFQENFEKAWSKYFSDFFAITNVRRANITYHNYLEMCKLWLKRRLSSYLFCEVWHADPGDKRGIVAILISYMKDAVSQRHGLMTDYTVGSILELCYNNKVLKKRQPANPHALRSDAPTSGYEDPTYILQVRAVFVATSILNDCLKSNVLLEYLYNFSLELRQRLHDHPVNEILALRLPELGLFLRSSEKVLAEPDMTLGNNFQIDDLNIIALKTIENLEICWTDYIEKHLVLDPATRKLYLAWTRMEGGQEFGRLQEAWLNIGDIFPYRPGRLDRPPSL